MTFSIVARADDGRAFGVAVASRFLAVGAYVPAARVTGALATQALANLAYKEQGLARLDAGEPADAVVAALTGADDKRDERQLGVVDAQGRSAAWTGSGCHAWAGHATGPGYGIQGNILTGPDTVTAMEQAWLRSDPHASLARRLLAALAAGDAAGGDRRGRQSAALLVVAPGGSYEGDDVVADLRVDDHPDPVHELDRLLGLHELYFGVPDPDRMLPLAGDVAAEVAERLARLGYAGAGLERELASWAGVENLEMRLAPGQIDPLVLGILRACAP